MVKCERFKDLIGKCPNHDINDFDLAPDFYDALNDSHKQKVDNMYGGYFYHAFEDEVFDILERVAEIDLQQMNASRNGRFLKRGGLHQVSFKESTLEKDEILKAVGKLSEKVDRLTTNVPLIKAKICSICCSKDQEDGACQGMTREEEEEQVHVVNYTTSWNEQRGQGSNLNRQTRLAPRHVHLIKGPLSSLTKPTTCVSNRLHSTIKRGPCKLGHKRKKHK